MDSSERQSGGVSGTVNAFNFIRRIGFPPAPEVISMFISLALLATVTSFPRSGLSLSSSLLVTTLAIVLPTLIGSLFSATIVLGGGSVLDFRRFMGMEVIAWSPILVILPLYSTLSELTGDSTLWLDGLFVGAALSIPVRMLTVFSMSDRSITRKLVGSISVPVAFLLMLAAAKLAGLLSTDGSQSIGLGVPREVPGFLVLVIACLLSWAGVARIIRQVDSQGHGVIGDLPMGLFRDFLRHWLKGEGGPLESRLAVLGRTGKIRVSTLAFEGSGGIRAGMIISNFHPGPYRDLGSGGLPSLLMKDVGRKNGSVVMVPHGISNHEYNIISHEDVLRLVNEASMMYPRGNGPAECSKLVRETSGDAKATAQIFGNTALLTLTLAPVDMEDIPGQVNDTLSASAEAKGLNVIIADAHNSLKTQVSINDAQAAMLTDAGIKALMAANRLPRSSFKIGAVSDSLAQFRVEDGIGPGGLTVIAIESLGQRVAYVTIDGNNMQQGFRQTLLNGLEAEGIDDGEVMTTDTHLVAGVVRSPLGYHPVGEGINQDLLVSKVREAAIAAVSSMRQGSAAFGSFELDVKVLGSESFQSITSFVGQVARRIGRSFLKLELIVLVVSVLVMLVL